MADNHRQPVRQAVLRWVTDRSHPTEWLTILGWAAGTGAGVVVVARLIHMLTLDAHPAVAITAVSVVGVGAIACLAGLFWASWRLRRSADDPAPFLLALGISVAAIGVCTEAFAGLTTLLWRLGVLSAVGPPSLWRTEEFYLWHLVDSIPLLDVQEGFQWPEPLTFAPPGGGLLLAYKLLLLVPLVRIVIGSYRSLSRHVLAKETDRQRLIERGVLRPTFWHPVVASVPRNRAAELSLVIAVPLAAAWPAALGLLLMPLVFESGTGLDGLVHGWLGDSDLAFLRTAPQLIAAMTLVVGAGGLMTELWENAPVRRGVDVLLTIGFWIGAAGLGIIAAAAVNLALLHVGLATPAQPLPPGEHVTSTLATYAWHVTAALPGPDIPATLGWSMPPGFTDRWSSLLILAAKAVAAGVLVAPIARAILAHDLHAQPRATTPLVGAAAEFADAFRAARALVDDATSDDMHRQFAATFRAEAAVEALGTKLNGIAALFGTGEVSEAADAAVGALSRRLDDGGTFRTRVRESHATRKERLLFRRFRLLASEALETAAGDVKPAVLKRTERP